MKTLLVLIFPAILFAVSPFDTAANSSFDLSMFNTKATPDNTKAMKNKKVRCRYVCDKKVYKEQKIADALSFYKRRVK